MKQRVVAITLPPCPSDIPPIRTGTRRSRGGLLVKVLRQDFIEIIPVFLRAAGDVFNFVFDRLHQSLHHFPKHRLKASRHMVLIVTMNAYAVVTIAMIFTIGVRA